MNLRMRSYTETSDSYIYIYFDTGFASQEYVTYLNSVIPLDDRMALYNRLEFK